MSTIARLTLEQYDRMIDAGVFTRREDRLEFIRGEIREMMPIGPEHETIVTELMYWSIESLPKDQVRVRVQNSVGLPWLDSAPEPDIAWVVNRDYRRARPTAQDVLLIIEVAESSLAYDRGEKAELYAQAGIAEYWIANIPHRAIEVRRDPGADQYGWLQTFTGDHDVQPLSMPQIALRPSTLWPGI